MLLKEWPPRNTQTKTVPINLVSFPTPAQSSGQPLAAVGPGKERIGAFIEDIEAIRERTAGD
jgi:hypothetical protein